MLNMYNISYYIYIYIFRLKMLIIGTQYCEIIIIIVLGSKCDQKSISKYIKRELRNLCVTHFKKMYFSSIVVIKQKIRFLKASNFKYIYIIS